MTTLMETQYKGFILRQISIISKLLSMADKALPLLVSTMSLSIIIPLLFYSIFLPLELITLL